MPSRPLFSDFQRHDDIQIALALAFLGRHDQDPGLAGLHTDFYLLGIHEFQDIYQVAAVEIYFQRFIFVFGLDIFLALSLPPPSRDETEEM